MNIKSNPSVNFHLTEACNMSCKFCFATFEDIPKQRKSLEERLTIIRSLAAAGFEKITFAGGEPTLVSHLPQLLEESKLLGMTTMVVTNGYRLLHDNKVKSIYDHLDWVILSIDSVSDEYNLLSGRSVRGELMTSDDYARLISEIKSHGKRLKINTVVSKFNHQDFLAHFIESASPERWKIFQALPIKGQNDKFDFEISEEEFEQYLKRNITPHLKSIVVPEDNDSMTGSYLMIAPNGKFFDNSKGYHQYSRKINEVGVTAALQDISFDLAKYIERGALYNWK